MVRIKTIYIERFGCYRHLFLGAEQLNQPLTVFFGPNEAGKSTLHAFIRFILFGFEEKGEHPYFPLEGGRMGGHLDLESRGHIFQVTRYSPPKKGSVTLTLNGQKQSEQVLQGLLGHLSFPMFQAVFSFSHQELSRLDVMGSEELQAYLHAAAMGGGAINLLKIEQELEKKKDALFRPKGNKPPINQLLSELIHQERNIERLKERMGEYVPLQKEREMKQKELEQLRKERSNLERRLKQLDLFKQAASLQKEMTRLQEALSQFPHLPFLQYQNEIRQLELEAASIRDKERQLVQLSAQIDQAQDELERQLRALGSPWRDNPDQLSGLTVEVKSKLWQLSRELQKIKEHHEHIIEDLEANRQKEERLRAQWEAEQNEYRQGELTEQHRLSPYVSFNTGLLMIAVLIMFIPLLPLLVRGDGLDWTELAGIAGGLLLVTLIYVQHKLRKAERQQFKQWQDEWRKIERAQNRFLPNIKEEWDYVRRLVQQLETTEREVFNRYQETLERWKTILNQLGWPTDLSPAILPELISRLSDLDQLLQKRQQLLRHRHTVLQEINDWKGQVRQMAEKLGLDEKIPRASGGVDAYILLDQLCTDLKQDEQRNQNKEQLEAKREDLVRRWNQIVCDIGESPSLLEQQLAKLDEESLSDEEEKLALQLASIQERIEKLATQVGRVESQLEELESEEQLTHMIQTFTERKEELNLTARQYSVLAVASHLCHLTRRLYEEKRQPTVLKEAGLYFKAMTGGRYTGIIAPLGEKALQVLDREGRRWPIRHLSQGTVEQLYLAMRFAFIKVFEKQVCLPVLLDDPLVNCDEERLEAVLKGLKIIANTHQVILFTCHAHILERVQAVFKEKLSVIRLAEAHALT